MHKFLALEVLTMWMFCGTAPNTQHSHSPCASAMNVNGKVRVSPRLLIPDSHQRKTLVSRPLCFPSTYNITDLSAAVLLWHWSRMQTTVILKFYCVSKVASVYLGTQILFNQEFPLKADHRKQFLEANLQNQYSYFHHNALILCTKWTDSWI